MKRWGLMAASLMLSLPAQAVNWLMMQGTEPPEATHNVLAFIQPVYVKDYSRALELGPNAGKYTLLTTVAPRFEDQEVVKINRARWGMHGNFTGDWRNSFTEKMNYFVLFAFGENLLTYDFMGDYVHPVAIDHLSLTFNHIPGARIRTGLFKTPGPEELFNGIFTLDYIEFTDFAARELLERFTTGSVRRSQDGGINETIGIPASKAEGFNAARDWGVQVFDSFRHDKWDLSYALMMGQGWDIQDPDSDPNPDPEWYGYLSAEYDLPGGKAFRKHGIKTYAWYQQGTRVFESDPLERKFDRVRAGVGLRALGKLFNLGVRQRLELDLMYGEGMIFVAPSGLVVDDDPDSPFGKMMYATDSDNRSRAFNLGVAIFSSPEWEWYVRYDEHDLLYETDGTIWTKGDARIITGTTYGLQYHWSMKQRLSVNYIARDVEAPNTTSAAVQDAMHSIEDRLAVQYTWIY